MIISFQDSPSLARETGCRVSPPRSPEGAAITGEPFAFEREVDDDGVADVERLQESIGSEPSSICGPSTDETDTTGPQA